MFHLSGSLVRSDSEGVQMLYLGIRSTDSKAEAVQNSVQEEITRPRTDNLTNKEELGFY